MYTAIFKFNKDLKKEIKTKFVNDFMYFQYNEEKEILEEYVAMTPNDIIRKKGFSSITSGKLIAFYLVKKEDKNLYYEVVNKA